METHWEKTSITWGTSLIVIKPRRDLLDIYNEDRL